MVNAKKILIETESLETYTLRVSGRETVRLYCEQCDSVEEMLDVNTAADISGAAAREILTRVEMREVHAPETSSGHLLICRASLENSINTDGRLGPGSSMLKESL
jgi:hypothetical protein